MRILYFTQYFPPEIGATQDRAHEMTRYLARAGHKVTVVTEVPNHPSGVIQSPYRGRPYVREQIDGIDVIRMWVATSPYRDFRNRLKFYGSYAAMATFAGLTLAHGHYDLVYATSPPLFVGVAGLAVAAVRRVPFVFEVRDLWPEGAIELGFLQNPRAVRLATAMEETFYDRATKIVVVTEGLRSRLVERGIDPAKLELIRNGASPRLGRATSRPKELAKREAGLTGKFVLLYAGLHGVAQGMETLVQVAHHLSAERDTHFVFVGEGPAKRVVRHMVEELSLTNVTLLPERPRDLVRALYDAADAVLVPHKDRPLFRATVPTKMFDAWICQRPVILSVAGEAQGILDDVGGGIAVEPENVQQIADVILDLRADPEAARQMGQRGYTAAKERFSREAMAQQLERVLSRICAA